MPLQIPLREMKKVVSWNLRQLLRSFRSVNVYEGLNAFIRHSDSWQAIFPSQFESRLILVL